MSPQALFLAIAAIVTIALCSFYFKRTSKQNFGTVIILNGPSSVGKSTIQKKVQEIFMQPFLKMGLDDLAFLPARYISINGPVSPADHGIWLKTTQQDGHQVVTIHYGFVAQNMIKGIHRTFAAFAQADNNIVVNYILYDSAWLSDLTTVLKDYKVYFIGVNAPLELIEQREQQRGNRLLGHARSHYETVHKGLVYDLEIDSSTSTPEQSALLIQKYIQEHPEPQAFKKNMK